MEIDRKEIEKIIELNNEVNRKVIELAQFMGKEAGEALTRVLNILSRSDKKSIDYHIQMETLRRYMGDDLE